MSAIFTCNVMDINHRYLVRREYVHGSKSSAYVYTWPDFFLTNCEAL